GGKVGNQITKLLEVLGFGHDGSVFNVGNADRSDEFSVVIKAEVEIVGKDEGIAGRFVAVKLFFVLLLSLQVGIVNIFGLDEAYGNFSFGKDVVGGTACHTRGFVGNHDVIQHGFQQVLQVA